MNECFVSRYLRYPGESQFPAQFDVAALERLLAVLEHR